MASGHARAGIDDRLAEHRRAASAAATAAGSAGTAARLVRSSRRSTSRRSSQRTLGRRTRLAAVDGSRVSVPAARRDERRRRPTARRAAATRPSAARRTARRTCTGSPPGRRRARTRCAAGSSCRSAAAGSLAVYSRRRRRVRHGGGGVLAAIARRAEPAVQNAFSYRVIRRLAAPIRSPALGSARAFAEALPREISAARRARPPAVPDPDRPRRLRARSTSAHLAGRRGNDALAGVRRDASARRIRGERRGLPELRRRGRVLPDPAGDDARGRTSGIYARLRVRASATRAARRTSARVTMSSGLAELRPDDTAESLKRPGRTSS